MNKQTRILSWISAHIYFDGNIYGDECDLVITTLLPSFVNKYQSEKHFEKYFFIRYSDPNPHVRVRLLGDKEYLENTLKTAFEKHVIGSFPSLMSEISKIKGKQADESNFSIKWIKYEPEIERYGGEYAINVAEELFYYSSKTANELLKTMGTNNNSSRLGIGLALMIILIHQLLGDKEKALTLIKRYSDGYLKMVAKEENYKNHWIQSFNDGFNKQSSNLIKIVNILWEGMENHEELPDSLNEYHNSLLIIKEKLFNLFTDRKIKILDNEISNLDTGMFQLVPSYIHMMNNRLGVPIKDESYLAHLIARGL